MNALGSLSDDESEDSDQEDGEEEKERETDTHSDSEEEQLSKKQVPEAAAQMATIAVTDFVKEPTGENLLALGENRADLLLQTATVRSFDLLWKRNMLKMLLLLF